jgi:hypothetical protein
VLAFVARAQKHLAPAGVVRVEAWSAEQMEFDFASEIARLVFTIRPHRNGRDWTADPNELHHGGWLRTLSGAVDYALFRSGGKVANVHVLDRGGKIQRVILADQSGYDAIPTIGPSIGLSNVSHPSAQHEHDTGSRR